VDLSTFQWIALVGGGLLNGMHKTGLNGLTMIAVLVGDAVSDETFGRLISASIIGGVGFTAYQEFSKRDVVVPKSWLVAALIGTVAGFSSMVGNAALLMSLYFIALVSTRSRSSAPSRGSSSPSI